VDGMLLSEQRGGEGAPPEVEEAGADESRGKTYGIL